MTSRFVGALMWLVALVILFGIALPLLILGTVA